MNYKILSIVFFIVVLILAAAVIYLLLPQVNAPSGNANLTNGLTNIPVNKNTSVQNQNTNNNVNNANTDNRKLLTPVSGAAYYNVEQKCLIFNNDQPTTNVTYSNSAKGLKLEVAYNPNWGNDQYRINAYDEVNLSNNVNLLLFGSIGASEGCSWVRKFSINFNQAQTANQAIDEINDTVAQITINPQLTNINGLNVVKYESDGLCRDTTYIIIGKKYNYVLSGGCVASATDLENIINSMTLIN